MSIHDRGCEETTCTEPAVACCDNCDHYFCAEHGQVGGDREGGTNTDGSPYGAYAVPSICYKCAEEWTH